MTHTAGAIRAANRLFPSPTTYPVAAKPGSKRDRAATIIDNETHCREMQNLVEQMAIVSLSDHGALVELKREALELIAKVRQ